MGPNLDNIPDELRAWDQWILWRWVTKEGRPKPTKVPFNARNFRDARVNDPSTFASFERTVEIYHLSQSWKKRGGKFDGIAFVFTANDPFAGLDIDGCIDPETGMLVTEDLYGAGTAEQIITTFDTYTEISPSGTGVKLIVKAQKTAAGLIQCMRKPWFELYDHVRLFTVTGNRFPGSPATVEERQDVYTAFHRQLWPPAPPRPVAARVGELAFRDDNEVLRIAFGARSEPKFTRLWAGDYSDYPNRTKDPDASPYDHSAGDLALCNYLRFFSCGDKAQIDRMFQASGMMRDKWFARSRGGRTYGAETIDLACNNPEYYDPERGKLMPTRGRSVPRVSGPGAQKPAGVIGGGGDDRRLDDLPPPPESETAGVPRAGSGRAKARVGNVESLRDESKTESPEATGDNPIQPRDGGGAVYHRTHGGNAQRFVDEYEDYFRYDHVRQWWFVWTGKRWEMDIEDIAGRMAWQMMRRLHIGREYDSELFKWMLKCDSPDAVTSCLNLAKRDPRVSTSVNKWDTDIWLFNVDNGTVDLRTGKLKPHTRADMITRLAPVTYCRGAQPVIWNKALEVWQPDAQIREFLQRAVGYSLTGSVAEQTLFFLYGLGSNGKSVFINTIMAMFGDYAHKASYEMLCDMGRSSSGPTPEISDLKGKRLVVPTEVEGGQRLKESMVKDLTGGDAIPTRDLYGKTTYSFMPHLTLWLYGNHRPPVRGVDEGIWRRIPLVPFDTFIPKGQRNTKLMEELSAEMSGIFNWALEGCLVWLHGKDGKPGLHTPASVMEATASYRETQDRIGQFIKDRCALVKGSITASAALRAAYVAWAESEGEAVANTKMFADRLEQCGVMPCRTTIDNKQVRAWSGIRLPDPNALGLDVVDSRQDPVSTGDDPFADVPAQPQIGLPLDTLDSTDTTFGETPTRTRAGMRILPSVLSIVSNSSLEDVESSGEDVEDDGGRAAIDDEL